MIAQKTLMTENKKIIEVKFENKCLDGEDDYMVDSRELKFSSHSSGLPPSSWQKTLKEFKERLNDKGFFNIEVRFIGFNSFTNMGEREQVRKLKERHKKLYGQVI